MTFLVGSTIGFLIGFVCGVAFFAALGYLCTFDENNEQSFE